MASLHVPSAVSLCGQNLQWQPLNELCRSLCQGKAKTTTNITIALPLDTYWGVDRGSRLPSVSLKPCWLAVFKFKVEKTMSVMGCLPFARHPLAPYPLVACYDVVSDAFLHVNIIFMSKLARGLITRNLKLKNKIKWLNILKYSRSGRYSSLIS